MWVRTSGIRTRAGRCPSSLNRNQFYRNYQHNWHPYHHDHKPSTQSPHRIQSSPGIHEVLSCVSYLILFDPHCKIMKLAQFSDEKMRQTSSRLISRGDGREGIQHACFRIQLPECMNTGMPHTLPRGLAGKNV